MSGLRRSSGNPKLRVINPLRVVFEYIKGGTLGGEKINYMAWSFQITAIRRLLPIGGHKIIASNDRGGLLCFHLCR